MLRLARVRPTKRAKTKAQSLREEIAKGPHHDSRGVVRQFAKDTIKQIDHACAAMKCKVLPYHSREGVFKPLIALVG